MPRVEAGTSSTRKPRQKQKPLFGLILPLNDEPPEWRKHAQIRARAGDLCPVCLGLKVTRYDVGINDEKFGKLYDCPACSEGKLSEYLRRNSGIKVQWMTHARPDDWRHAKAGFP